MRLRKVKDALDIINRSTYIINEPFNYKGKWHTVFKNEHPIYIEIGMGKGQFIIENAKRFPEINFIGIERFDSVIVRAIQKLDTSNLTNLKLLKMDAIDIEHVFDHEVDRLYLNFSDPWPKDRHADRRLTSPKFLDRYRHMFLGDNVIHMKTDNEHLLVYSLVSLSNYGYKFDDVNLSLHKAENLTIITTEYEDRFLKLNKPIYKIEASMSVKSH